MSDALPISTRELPAGSADSARRGASGPQAVLVVDDDVRIARALADLVTLDGHAATVVTNGAQALERMLAAPPDLVMLDVKLPGIDGAAVLRAMRAAPALRTIPVAIVTGSFEDEVMAECLDLGIVDLIRKPFHRTETRLRIRAQLRLAAAQRRGREATLQLQAISGAAQDAIIIIDDEGLIAHWSTRSRVAPT